MADLTTLLSKFLAVLYAGGNPPATGSGFVVSLTTNTTTTSNSGTGETDLMTYSLPANTLASTGQKVRITAVCTTANNGNSKTFKVYFGSTAFFNLATSTAATTVRGELIVVRTGAATQAASGWYTRDSGSPGVVTGSPTETLSGAVTIKITGQSGTGSNDITAVLLMVEWLP